MIYRKGSVAAFKNGTPWTGYAVAQLAETLRYKRKVAGSIPDGVIGIFHWHNPSDRIMVLRLTQPLTEMSNRNIFWGVKGGRCVGLTILPPSCADCLEIWAPQTPGTLKAWTGIALPFILLNKQGSYLQHFKKYECVMGEGGKGRRSFCKKKLVNSPVWKTYIECWKNDEKYKLVFFLEKSRFTVRMRMWKAKIIQGGSNMTGTDLYVNKPHCAAAVRPWESEATTSTLPSARVRTCSVLSGSY